MLDLNNKTILVTGGNGFIGNNFIRLLYNNYNNLHIINIDKLGIGSTDIDIPNNNVQNVILTNFNIDLCNKKELEYIIDSYEYDYVFHFAAESHVDRSISDPNSFIINNIVSTSNLLELFHKLQPKVRIIAVSTDEVYGHLDLWSDPFTEYSNLHPRSPYSASKASSDMIALSFYETFGMDVLVTRCCNNYGPFQCDEKFIPTIVKALCNGRKIPVYGKGENIREWIHVDDHNKSILEIADRGESGKVYNIGSGQEKTNLELIENILDILYPDIIVDIDDHIEYVTDRKGHDFRYAISSIHYFRGFKLKNYNKSLEETVNFYKNKYEI